MSQKYKYILNKEIVCINSLSETFSKGIELLYVEHERTDVVGSKSYEIYRGWASIGDKLRLLSFCSEDFTKVPIDD